MTDKITAWSYSRYATWKQCPGKAKLLYLEKLKEPPSPALDKGLKVHTELENFLKGYWDLPEYVHEKLRDYYQALRETKPAVELQVAFDKSWQPVTWFAKNAWARIKIDALSKDGTKVVIVDHKTGKIREGEYDEQLELYALTAFLMFPTAETAKTELAFVDQGIVLPAPTYTRADDMDRLLARWEQRIEPMMLDTTFEYTPNQYCLWCYFRKDNGGPCTK